MGEFLFNFVGWGIYSKPTTVLEKRARLARSTNSMTGESQGHAFGPLVGVRGVAPGRYAVSMSQNPREDCFKGLSSEVMFLGIGSL